MNEPRDPDETFDDGSDAGRGDPDGAHDPTVELGSLTADSLEVGLAAAFGRNPGPPRSSLGSLRTVVLKEAEGESSVVVTPRSDAMPPRSDVGDRYQLSGEIARGGMGAVLRGRDVDLGRDLAVKVLLERHANRPDVARRFIEEAQIGGQLQHPGVVPVYDIGRFGDRPFFTMKLVKGQTLAAILSERPEPAADRPRLLAMALQVAQAMAYAHAKGVIHRDLKPANIMVGAFGEVQVMDWGLAKVLAEGGVADEERASRAHQEPEDVTTIRTARSAGSVGSLGTETEAGSIMGTPAYMPPEQASGDVSLLDRRADVFGLGAILCEILTGKPPYLGRSAEEVRRKAANGDLADAATRLDACGADAELIGLARACLAREAVDRPRDAQGVVEALTAHLDGVQERLQAAERERAVASAREVEERKRRKVQLALAGAVALLLMGGGTVAWWQNVQAGARRETDLRRKLVDEQRAAADSARLARNAEAVAGLLGQAEGSLRADDAAKAAVALDAARRRSAEGGAEAEAGRLGRFEADLALLSELDAVDQFRWTPVENKFPDAAAVAARTRDVLSRSEADPSTVSADDAAARVSASAVRGRIVPALDRLLLPVRLVDVDKLPAEEREEFTPQLRADLAAMAPKAAGVRAVLRDVDADPYRDAVRDAIVAVDRAKFVDLAGRADALEQPPGFVAILGESQAIPVERRRQLLQAAVGRRPGDLGLLMAMGATHPVNHMATVDDRLRWFQAAVASAPANAIAYNSLGHALWDKGLIDEAIVCIKKAIEIDPKFAVYHANQGVALLRKGRLDEAVASNRKAIEIDPKRPGAHSNLGDALIALGRARKDRGKVDEAVAEYREAIRLKPNDAGARVNLGNVLIAEGRTREAVPYLASAWDVRPGDNLGLLKVAALQAWFRRDAELAATCRRARDLAKDTKDPTVAEAAAKSSSLRTPDDPADRAATLALARTTVELAKDRGYNGWFGMALGMAEYRAGDDAAAAEALRAVVGDHSRQISVTSGFYLAMSLSRQGKDAEARRVATEAVSRMRPLPPDDDNPLAGGANQDDLIIWLACKEARALLKLDAALTDAEKAVELDPKSAQARWNLGRARMGTGDLDAAIAAFRMAIELDPKEATFHPGLALVLKDKGNDLIAEGRTREAIPYLASAWEADPGDTLLLIEVAALQAWFRRDAELAATCRRARDLAKDAKDPIDVAERTAKCSSLRPPDDPTDRAATLALARRAVELAEDRGYNGWLGMALGMAEYRAGDDAAAAESLRAVIGDVSRQISATSGFYLAMSLSRQGKDAEARRVATEAVSRMRPLPPDDDNPLAGGASQDDLITWLACKEARALLKLDAASGAPIQPKGR